MAEQPNVLIIMTDQHAPSVMGCAGDSLVRTPNLDRMASEGMRFTNAYCPAPLCVPSRMSFMSCRTPSANEVWNNNHMLDPAIPTWAHGMTLAGYETILIGRMHFVGTDTRHGFEKRPIGEGGAGYPGSPRKGGPMWQYFPGSTSGQSRPAVEIAGRGPTHYQWQDEERTRVAKQFFEERATNPQERPFAAVLGYTLPHCPFIAPKDLFDYYYDKIDIPSVEENQPETIKRFRKLRGITEPDLDEERIRVARAAYYGLCEHIDALVGEVLETLETTGIAKDTLIIYTSDHGEMAGNHGCWWKSNFYEDSVGVPLIARYPGMVPAGTTNEVICNLMDLGPTAAELAGNPLPFENDGESLLQAMKTGTDGGRSDETYSEFVDRRGGAPLACRMIRTGPWKLWVYADGEGLPPALFNVEEDPEEKNDLGTDPAHEQIRNELLDRIYDGWDPQYAMRRTNEKHEAWDILTEWGKTVQPDNPDKLVYPPSEYEAEVELL